MPIRIDPDSSNLDLNSAVGLTKSAADVHYVNQSGDRMKGDLDLDNHKIENAVLDNCILLETPEPTANSLINKAYLDSRLAGLDAIYVNESGDTMEGELRMTRSKITGLPNPTEDTDAVNKKYVDRYRSYFLFNKAVEMQKDIDMKAKKLTGLPTPTEDTDAVNKKYVDAMSKTPVSLDRIIPFSILARGSNDRRVHRIQLNDYSIRLPDTRTPEGQRGMVVDIQLLKGRAPVVDEISIDFISQVVISILDENKVGLLMATQSEDSPGGAPVSQIRSIQTKLSNTNFSWSLIFPSELVPRARYLRVFLEYAYPANFGRPNAARPLYYSVRGTISVSLNYKPTLHYETNSGNLNMATRADEEDGNNYILSPEAARALF